MKFLRRYRVFFLVMAVFSVIAITVFYNVLSRNSQLPVYNPVMVNPELVDSTVQHIGRYHTVSDFSFVNQNGEIVTNKDYKDKVYIADFFFTTCPTICPKMTTNMKLLQGLFQDEPRVKLLSHTVTPEIDSVPVLKKYAISQGVDDHKWNLVTGDKRQIYEMARKSYLAVKLGSPDELYDMVHTENFVLVDQKRRVRGFYDGTNPDEIQRLAKDIKLLLKND
jgi:protein SCO1